MSKHMFEASLVEGRDNEMAKWVGEWQCTTRVWLEPGKLGKLGDEVPIRGRIRSTLGGPCLVHEYETRFMGEPEQGSALLTWHIDRQCHECAGIDSAHGGTRNLCSEGVRDQGRFSVLGSYGGQDGDPPWGWRTEIDMPDQDHPSIVAVDISVEGEEPRATGIAHVRLRGWSAASQGVTLCIDPANDFR